MDTPTAPTPTSHYFTSLGTRLHYLDWGNSAAPVLVLVHGGFDHARSWDWTARALARDYHVIVPDLRGHGDSAWSSEGSYAIQNYVYDLAQLVDTNDEWITTRTGIKKRHILAEGESLGDHAAAASRRALEMAGEWAGAG